MQDISLKLGMWEQEQEGLLIALELILDQELTSDIPARLYTRLLRCI